MTNRTAISLISLISLAAILFLFWLIYGVEAGDGGHNWTFLPATNAFFNGVSASCVVAGLLFIRKGAKRAHGMCMLLAFLASSLFLIGYIVHHTINGDTRFLTTGWLRPTYFFILITHVVLSIVVLPMVLTTFFFAASKRWSSHRALARWTYPVWLYVSITGVIVYVFLRHLNA